jgi:hypothetical protein
MLEGLRNLRATAIIGQSRVPSRVLQRVAEAPNLIINVRDYGKLIRSAPQNHRSEALREAWHNLKKYDPSISF